LTDERSSSGTASAAAASAAAPATAGGSPASSAPPLSWRKVGLLTVLYLVQGIPYGFLLLTLPIYLRAEGMSLTRITMFMGVGAPWVLKFLWAPLADRYYWPRLGRRRSWILPAQAGLALSLLATALSYPQLGYSGLLVMMGVVSLFSATQDIGVDGLAVDILDDHERGVGNSVQAAAFKIGMVGGSYGLGLVAHRIGLAGCFHVMAAAVAVAMVVPLLLREAPPPPLVQRVRQGDPSVSVLRLFGTLFSRRGAGWFLLFVLLVKSGDSIANPLFRPLLYDGNLSPLQINDIMNLGGMAATLLGSALCGFVILKIGRRAALWLTVAGQGGSHLAWALLACTTLPVFAPMATAPVWAVGLFEHFVSGMLTVVVFTVMMDAVAPEVGGSQYTLLASLYAGAGILVNMGAGPLAQHQGYVVAFAVAGGLTLVCLPLVGLIRRRGYLEGQRPRLDER
jgi:MFS family permease